MWRQWLFLAKLERGVMQVKRTCSYDIINMDIVSCSWIKFLIINSTFFRSWRIKRNQLPFMTSTWTTEIYKHPSGLSSLVSEAEVAVVGVFVYNSFKLINDIHSDYNSFGSANHSENYDVSLSPLATFMLLSNSLTPRAQSVVQCLKLNAIKRPFKSAFFRCLAIKWPIQPNNTLI